MPKKVIRFKLYKVEFERHAFISKLNPTVSNLLWTSFSVKHIFTSSQISVASVRSHPRIFTISDEATSVFWKEKRTQWRDKSVIRQKKEPKSKKKCWETAVLFSYLPRVLKQLEEEKLGQNPLFLAFISTISTRNCWKWRINFRFILSSFLYIFPIKIRTSRWDFLLFFVFFLLQNHRFFMNSFLRVLFFQWRRKNCGKKKNGTKRSENSI